MVGINTKVGAKGQIVIPKVFRDEYNISPGDEIVIKEKNNELVLEKPKDPVKELEKWAKIIKFNKKVDPDSIEEEYEERWKKSQSIT